MESQPQNPEFRNNPENFHPSCYAFACFLNFTPQKQEIESTTQLVYEMKQIDW